MKKQNGNQTSVLSKPTTSRTVRSPRARGKRAPSKMDESVKVKENIPDENKECKDDVDKESVPLSEKEKMEEMIRRDSTLSNGDLDTVSIPNAVHGVKDPQVENTVKHSDELEDNKTDNENLNDESTDKIETDNTAVADKTERNDVENRSYIENLNRYQERRTTGSAVSLNSKEGKGEVTKSSTSSLNLVEKKEDSIENSTGSLNSKESKKTPSKSSNGQFNNSKRQSIKASTVSINSKESRPSSLKTSYKSEAISLTSFETGGTKQTTPKKEVPVTKDEKPKSEVETTVIVTETNCNGTNHVVHNDLTKTITGKTDKISLTVPGFIVEGENTQITKGEARKDSVISDVTRRESTKYSLGSRKSMDMRVQYTTVQMPTTEDKTKPSVYATDDSWIRIAIPYLPVGLAVFCLLMNICVPGLGKPPYYIVVMLCKMFLWHLSKTQKYDSQRNFKINCIRTSIIGILFFVKNIYSRYSIPLVQ